jgi:ATP-dependent DNA helicase RecQ
MDDQVDNLHRTSINRNIAIHSGMKRQKKEAALKQLLTGFPRFVYIAPERFQSEQFREDLKASPIAGSVTYVVVDEAHCVSEWGHDFRPAYLNVGRLAREFCAGETREPPLIALTGTASQIVLVDVQRELDIDHRDDMSLVSADSFDRRELEFLPLVSTAADKEAC